MRILAKIWIPMLFLALLHPASALSEEEFNKVVDAVSSVGVEVDTKAYGNIGSIINGHYKYTGPIAYAGITADVSIKIQDYTEIMKIYGYKNYKEIPASGSNILRSDLNREKARCDEYQSGSDDIFKQISTIEGTRQYCYHLFVDWQNIDGQKYWEESPRHAFSQLLTVTPRAEVATIINIHNFYTCESDYVYTVCDAQTNDCVEVVDSEKYSNYVKCLEDLNQKTAEFTKTLSLKIESAVLSALGAGETATPTTTATPAASYTIQILSPSQGATVTSFFNKGGVWSDKAFIHIVNIKAKVSGEGASNLYAVVIAPDGIERKFTIYNNDLYARIAPKNINTGKGDIWIKLYGETSSGITLLATKSLTLNFISPEIIDGKDNDGDGLVDCNDPDIATSDECVYQKKLEWAESVMKRHIEYMESQPDRSFFEPKIAHIKNLYEKYKNDPDRMVAEMNRYMDAQVYHNQKIKTIIQIFQDDPDKAEKVVEIAEKYKNDPWRRNYELNKFVYENSKSEAEREAVKNAILTGIINPPKWFVGGQYGSGGALDWAQFVASNFEQVGDTVKLKGAEKVKFFTTPAKIYLVAQDAKALMDHARQLEKMNLDSRTKVSIVVLDGATKIGKLLDPTGYFGNMADATVDALIKLRKKIEDRNGGWIQTDVGVLHETSIPGIYEDYETGRKYKRISGGWFEKDTWVEVKGNV
ncbi:hypothetical protein [Archaeoglobus fulgidus]|uniref:hypothetical protein n=1 Tax=Archaeoglobus fulgidus TaxID=2234 RepID=UPI0011D099B9|nr:hypothetical protein [Archaeoglobus fulgidus]